MFVRAESTFVIATLVCCLGASMTCVLGQIPGMQTAAGVLASSTDGLSRYFAPDGPIQPALTAIGGLPNRAVEYLNRGISAGSLSLNNQAQRFAQSAGTNEPRMPGLETLRNSMPQPVSNLGGFMASAVASKNGFIRDQANRGIEASSRLRSLMDGGINGYASQSN